jgi:capsular polysaccharide transport system permease protein
METDTAINTHAERSPLEITLSVWKALFLREAVIRISRRRLAWIWLIMEPAAHIAVLMLLYMVVRVRHIGGMNAAVWIMVGLLSYFMFFRTGTQTMNAVDANEALFTYRQVKPVDSVLVRAALEGFLTILIACFLFAFAGMLGIKVIPPDPLSAAAAFFGMWLLGLGFGLVTSVAVVLLPEVGHIVGLLTSPLYFISSIIFPLSGIPYPYRGWLLLNPLAHGVEFARLGFAPNYQGFEGLSILYVYGCSLVLIFLGLVLHNRFAVRLAMK